MAQFSVKRQRLDPYKSFKFHLNYDGKYVAVMNKLTVGLTRTSEVVQHRQGGDSSTSRESPCRIKYEAVTLEKGVTYDTEFQSWANNVWAFGGGLGSEISLKNFRKDIILEFYNEAGQLTIAYRLHRCWVSEYLAMPDLGANANAVAIQHIKLENEGWERDL